MKSKIAGNPLMDEEVYCTCDPGDKIKLMAPAIRNVVKEALEHHVCAGMLYRFLTAVIMEIALRDGGVEDGLGVLGLIFDGVEAGVTDSGWKWEERSPEESPSKALH